MPLTNKNIYYSLVMNSLYGTKFLSVKEIANELGVSTKTISNNIIKIKKSNSKLETKDAKYRILPTLDADDLFLTNDDIDLLFNEYFFKKIDDESISKKLLFLLGEYLKQKKKLFVSKDDVGKYRDYFKEVAIIKNAIKNNLCINILNYMDRDEGKKSYKGVTPVTLDERRNKVYCLVKDDNNNNFARAFNFERMSGITASKTKALSKAKCNIDHLLDVFGFLPKQSKNGSYKIGMRMTNFAYSLLIRQFPEIDNPKYITKTHKQKMPYTLKVKTSDPFAIARFFVGIASHVEIIRDQTDSISKDKIKDWFDKYARVGLEKINYI